MIKIIIVCIIAGLVWLKTTYLYKNRLAPLILSLIAGLIGWSIVNSIYVVREKEAIVVERLGKFNRILKPGIHCIIPLVEHPRMLYLESSFGLALSPRIDLREKFLDRFVALTNEGVYGVDLRLSCQIYDPYKAVYSVASLYHSLDSYLQEVVQDNFKKYSTKQQIIDNIPILKSAILNALQNKMYSLGVQINDITQFKIEEIPIRKKK